MKLTPSLISILLSINSAVVFAASTNELIHQSVEKNNAKYIQIYKSIHKNPELSFMEVETAAIIAKELKSYGYNVTDKIAKTGIAAVMKNGDGPVVMYRADMDANAVKETTGLPYASQKNVQLADGTHTAVAHACGHDAHVVWMLGVAKFFSEHKNLWKGTVVFIGQPAEETIEGAEAMINDGLYTKYKIPKPDYLLGMHTAPIAVGMVAAASGTRMAGTDQIDVTFNGVGGHGSAPHHAKDPVIMATSAITQYQTLISRNVDPQNPSVLTIGSIQAGSNNNVIPASALLKINLRWFKESDRKIMVDGIQRINESIAIANNLEPSQYPTIKFKGHSSPLVNNSELTQSIYKTLSTSNLFKSPQFILNENNFPSFMASEDFHHLVIHNDKKNYSYLYIGIAEPKLFAQASKNNTVPFYPHNGNYQVDLAAIPFGTEVGITSLLSIFNQ